MTDAGERFAWMANWDAQIVRLMVFDAETLDVTFSLDLDRSSAARPVTHMGMRDRLLSVRGAIGPGGEHVVRVWDTASGAVLADAPIEASGFEP